MEELFDPKLGYPITKTALEARNTRILPERLGQRNNTSPIFIPTIPQMIDALLDQDRYHHDHAGDSNFNILASQPAEHIMGSVRSLYLEHPTQQQKVLPHLTSNNLSGMEAKLAGFKLRPAIMLDNLTRLPTPSPLQ
ncbi:hypothetical protein PAAG_12696 [Paracoccidioides lutzii Pb01]|uniref:Uncharacterized protein n=1 Tax=Paracoccidioides lutzii (strain ATCC MYA-826 / Pb01) TaxID=502779 RepID=A0A0A2VIC1_PARBA|nr:hypothetical protein PAAG_12696 [Paracoccidioides lutzii Pb01]KGQ00649.1 hypothetical protein PAAG_12696 [Paracoccidioides lutzii Pb01]